MSIAGLPPQSRSSYLLRIDQGGIRYTFASGHEALSRTSRKQRETYNTSAHAVFVFLFTTITSVAKRIQRTRGRSFDSNVAFLPTTTAPAAAASSTWATTSSTQLNKCAGSAI